MFILTQYIVSFSSQSACHDYLYSIKHRFDRFFNFKFSHLADDFIQSNLQMRKTSNRNQQKSINIYNIKPNPSTLVWL